MFKRLIASTLAAATILTSITTAAIKPAQAHHTEPTCYSDLVDRPGDLMYGKCIPYAVQQDSFKGDALTYMNHGMNAANPEACETTDSDWDTAIINFQRAYDSSETGSYAEAEAKRALIAAITAKQGLQSGEFKPYLAWVLISGVLSPCD